MKEREIDTKNNKSSFLNILNICVVQCYIIVNAVNMVTCESENEVGLTISDIGQSLQGNVVFSRVFGTRVVNFFPGSLSTFAGAQSVTNRKYIIFPDCRKNFGWKNFFHHEEKNIFRKKYFEKKYFLEKIFFQDFWFSMTCHWKSKILKKYFFQKIFFLKIFFSKNIFFFMMKKVFSSKIFSTIWKNYILSICHTLGACEGAEGARKKIYYACPKNPRKHYVSLQRLSYIRYSESNLILRLTCYHVYCIHDYVALYNTDV